MTEGFIRTVPPLPADFSHNSFDIATAVNPSSASASNIYAADIKQDWAIGLVAHGGYACAVAASAARLHISTHYPMLNHPDVVTVQQEFISACNLGAAEIEVTELSLGRQYSTLRVQLFQYASVKGPSKRFLRIEALIRQGNLHRESLNTSGITLTTIPYTAQYGLLPRRTECSEWQDIPALFVRRTAYAKVTFLLAPVTASVNPELSSSIRQQWMTWRDPDDRQKGFNFGISGHWYPTMSMSIEVKKGPPEGKQGWEWLFLRFEANQIQNGRMDLNVVVLDEDGDLVALSRHAALIVPSERNFKRGDTASQSKI